MNENLKSKISMLPTDSGVYVMLNSEKTVIYVGKAKVLKNRVRQYFQGGKKPEKVSAMVSNIDDFYYIITASEIDALSLENNLIKKYKPRYNILLKDDKTYPYIRVNLKEKFPSFSVTRKLKKDGAKYFGPFMGGVSASDTLEIINTAFMTRSCQIKIDAEKPKKECLNYHIKKCLAPCSGRCDEREYLEKVNGAIDFLSGNDDSVEDILREKMLKFSALEEFEIALNYRDKLKMLEKIKLKRITSLNKFVDIDIIAVTTNGVYSSANLLITRGGRMQGGKNFALEDASETNADRILGFITQYYQNGVEIPDEIIVSVEDADNRLIADYFKVNFGKTVVVTHPERGVKRQLMEMAKKNAEDYLEKEIDKIKHKDDMTRVACEKLKKVLSLKRYPRRMECFDISHISGVDKVGSMVVFIDGEPDRNSYRRFKIKTVEGNDDFSCLKEVLKRRLSKIGTDEEENFPKPDLVIIDGGKGQLSSVKEIFDQMQVDFCDLISLAEREEEIFTLFSKEPIVLPHRDYVLRMLQRIRDEAHRFAITYHKTTHGKRNLASIFEEIGGIGPKKRKAILDKFGSIENIKRASVEDIMQVDGIGLAFAKKIKEFFISYEG
ncbi:MAG: excinuclease ABC subunit UvrC [Clostridiales bacterium]|nr:excinuclease ABC subunit UvrC [Clostridiales bacterium]